MIAILRTLIFFTSSYSIEFSKRQVSQAHRSILELFLNCDKEAAESPLGCGLFCKDTAGQMEEMDISANPVLNTGLGTLSEWTNEKNLSSYKIKFTLKRKTYSKQC